MTGRMSQSCAVVLVALFLTPTSAALPIAALQTTTETLPITIEPLKPGSVVSSPTAHETLRLEGPDGSPFFLNLSVPLLFGSDFGPVPRLSLEAGRKVDQQALQLRDLAKSGQLREDGTVPVIVRTSQPVPGDILSDLRNFASLSLVAGRVGLDDLTTLALAPGVERVFLDGIAHADLAESVPLVRAHQVHQRTDQDGQSIVGAGITIAILDTGVDYIHPDLGGCFGFGCKVVGGYDFVNNDPDPMDDHGHGTHVAATAAGMAGVAPGANIVASKVLSSGGFGFYSWIIAGIENATLGGADIISMSLGGPGTTDGPLAMAVDWASTQGVLVVSAAGNGGCDGCIGEPAAALSGLAVGATTKWDTMAWFSSHGPVYDSAGRIRGIKPDVSAPGLDIIAAVPTGTCALCDPSGQRMLSGTSMATPHVSGAAALLLQAHPNWTIEDVKGTLMGGAVQIPHADARTQGAGRIDAINALDANISMMPGNGWLGISLSGNESFDRPWPVVVKNLGDRTQNVTLAASLIVRPPLESAPGAPNPSGPSVTAAAVDNSTGPVRPILDTLWYDLTFTNLTLATLGEFFIHQPSGEQAWRGGTPYDDGTHPGRYNVTFPQIYLWETGAWSLQGPNVQTLFEVRGDTDVAPSPEPAAFALPPGESLTATLPLLIDNSEMADGWYEGSLVASTPTSASRAKFTFVKTGILHLTLDPATFFAVIQRDGEIRDVLLFPPVTVDYLGGAGTYDVQSVISGCPPAESDCPWGSMTFVYRDAIPHSSETSIDLQRPGDGHALRIVNHAPSGTPSMGCTWLPSSQPCIALGLTITSNPRTNGWFGITDSGQPHYFEETDWHVGRWSMYDEMPATYITGGASQGMHANATIDVGLSQFRERGIRFASPQGYAVNQRTVFCNVGNIGIGSGRLVQGERNPVFWGVPEMPPVNAGGTSFPAIPCESFFLTAAMSPIGVLDCNWPDCKALGVTLDQVPSMDGFTQRRTPWSGPIDDAFSFRDGDIVILDGAPSYHGQTYATPGQLSLYPATGFTYNEHFVPASGAHQWIYQTYDNRITYEVTVDGVSFADGPLPMGWEGAPHVALPTHGQVRLKVQWNGALLENQQPGTTTYEVSYDGSNATGYLPGIEYARVTHEDNLSTTFHAEDARTFHLRFDEYTESPSNVTVELAVPARNASSIICCLAPDNNGRYAAELPHLGDGEYTLTIRAKDQRGIEFQLVHEPAFRVGNMTNAPPRVAIMHPAEGATVDGFVLVSGTATDPDGNATIQSAEVSLDNGTTWSKAKGTQNWSWSFDSHSFPNQPLIIQARANDGQNYSSVEDVTINIRNDHPGFAYIETPRTGANVSGTILIEGRASDEDGNHDIENVEVCIRNFNTTNQDCRIANGTVSWRLPWNTTQASDGRYSLYATATGANGTGPAHNVTVTVHNAPNAAPVVTIAAPTDGQEVSGFIVAHGAAGDADQDALVVEVRIDDDNWHVASGSTNWTYGLNTTTLPNGTHGFFVRAFDGKTYSEIETVSFVVANDVPNAAPRVRIRTPAPGDTVHGTVLVEGKASDEDGTVRAVQLQVDGGEWQNVSGTKKWSTTVDTTLYENGQHTFTARAYDGETWSDPDDVWVTITNEVPNARPTATITRPGNGDTVGGDVLVTGLADDADGVVEMVQVSLDGVHWLVANGTEYWRASIDTRNMSNGPADVVARAFDGEDWSTLTTVPVTIYNAPPPGDLTVSSIETLRGPIQALGAEIPNEASETRIVRLTITNLGPGPALPSVVEAYVTASMPSPGMPPVRSAEHLGERIVGELATGETATVEFEWYVGDNLGDQTIIAEADAYGDVQESDEFNNIRTQRTHVRIGGLGGIVVAAENDGGSGKDAPDSPTPSIWVVDQSHTRGSILARYVIPAISVRDSDFYAFHARAGDVVELKIAGFEACARIVGSDGNPVAGNGFFEGPVCAQAAIVDGGLAIGKDSVIVPHDGTYYVGVKSARQVGSTPYDVTMGLNAPAPEPSVP